MVDSLPIELGPVSAVFRQPADHFGRFLLLYRNPRLGSDHFLGF